MAFTAYTADRAGRLSPGLTMDRKRHDDVQPSVLQQHVDAWYPHGVTSHGEVYLLRSSLPPVIDPVVELACELVRQAEAVDAPSRFESVFGCETTAEAQIFAADHGAPDARIFEIEADHPPFRADMRCLNIRGTILVTAYGARRYWSQEPSDIELFPGGQPQSPFWELLLRPPVRVIRQVA